MTLSIDDVRRFVRADQGLAVVSFARPDGSVHSSLVNAGVIDHPVTGAESVALVVRGNTVKLRHWRHTPKATLVFKFRLVMDRRGGERPPSSVPTTTSKASTRRRSPSC